MSSITGLEEKLDTLIATIELAHGTFILGGTPMFSAREVRKDVDPVLWAAWKAAEETQYHALKDKEPCPVCALKNILEASTEAQRVKKDMEDKARWKCTHCDWHGDTPIRGNQQDPGPFCPKCSEDVGRAKKPDYGRSLMADTFDMQLRDNRRENRRITDAEKGEKR